MSKYRCIVDLLEKPESRATGAGAFDKHGVSVDPRSDEACSWCLVGAANRCGIHVSELAQSLGLIAFFSGTRLIQAWEPGRHEGGMQEDVERALKPTPEQVAAQEAIIERLRNIL